MKTLREIRFSAGDIARAKDLRKEIQKRLPMSQRLCSIIKHSEWPVVRHGEVIFRDHDATIRVAMSAREGRRFAAEMAERENKYK